MLYLTTRDKYDTYTAAHAMKQDTAPNGGYFVPFKMPKIDMQELTGQSFGDCVAFVLNQFFGTSLTGKEVEFCIGRNPIRIKSTYQRTLIAELYRNLDGSYARMERRLAAKICGCADTEVTVTSWICIAIRTAVLFGVFQELKDAKMPVDIALPCGDFRLIMAAWYGREMGLPIGNIICACGHDSGVWDLLRQGQMRTTQKDSALPEIERLICGTLGVSEALKYYATCDDGGLYTLEAEETERLNRGIFCAVVSDDRVENAISSVYRTNSYILESGSAAAYSGLMDYRARMGASHSALLLADCNPADQAGFIAGAMHITENELSNLLR